MSDTVLRLGLWTFILVLALFILGESFHDQPLGEMIPHPMLKQALVVAGVLVIAGLVLRILGAGAKVVSKNRCQVCRTPVAKGAIYCREHLRTILNDEDERTHMTKTRRK